MPEPKTAVVIVHWNGGDRTLRCLAALRKSSIRLDPVIVVDNGSTDGSVARIRSEYPDVKVIAAGDNRGYAGGNNLGIVDALRSGAQAVLLLNNDVEIAPDCVAALEAELRDPRVGAAGPLVVLPASPPRPARIWAAGGELTHRENVSRLRGHGQVLNGRYAAAEDVDYLPGCAILVKREVLESVGALDESYFCYMEDVEYGRRIAGAGYSNRLVPAARAIHDASASTGGGYTPARKYMNAVNSVRFLRRHASWRGWIGFAIFDVLLWPLCLATALARGRPSAAFAKLRGLFDGLRGVTITKEHVARYVPPASES
jgi:GT2 family glycosyltransferase